MGPAGWSGSLYLASRYPNDIEGASIPGVVHTKVFADGIVVGEVFPDERFIHDRHRARGAGIALREIAATHDALSYRRKIPTAHPVPRDTFGLRCRWITPPLDGNQFTPVIAAERTPGRQAC